jgi:hypothetical protein
MVWPALLIVGAVVGFYAGRVLGWWPLVAIPALAALIATKVELEGGVETWLAFVFSVVLAGAIAAGRGLERLRTR